MSTFFPLSLNSLLSPFCIPSLVYLLPSLTSYLLSPCLSSLSSPHTATERSSTPQYPTTPFHQPRSITPVAYTSNDTIKLKYTNVCHITPLCHTKLQYQFPSHDASLSYHTTTPVSVMLHHSVTTATLISVTSHHYRHISPLNHNTTPHHQFPSRYTTVTPQHQSPSQNTTTQLSSHHPTYNQPR